MHKTALLYGKAFFATYVPANKNDLIIVEIGSQDINGSLRQYKPLNSKYIGLDFVMGKSVDILLKDAYHYPLTDNYADIVITSSCFEHSQFFWLSFLESLRILKPDGLMYINAPSNGPYHPYPTDNWRFYPDSSKALSTYANMHGINSAVLESFIGVTSTEGSWKDFVAVFIKDVQYAKLYPNRIYNTISEALEPTNIWTYGNDKIIDLNVDMRQDKFHNYDIKETSTLLNICINDDSVTYGILWFMFFILAILIVIRKKKC